MFHEVQLAAHLLNPKISNTFIIDYAQAIGLDKNKILQDLGEYCGKQSLWDDPLIWEAATCTDPITWWKGYCPQRELPKLAVIILNLPASAAACERNWSNYSNVKTKKRNRTTVDRTKKLVSINYNLKLFKKIERNKNYKMVNEDNEEIILEVVSDVDDDILEETESTNEEDHQSSSDDDEEEKEYSQTSHSSNDEDYSYVESE
jgi:hypothetical protein